MILRKIELEKEFDEFAELFEEFKAYHYQGGSYRGKDEYVRELDNNFTVYNNVLQELVWSAQNGVNENELYELYNEGELVFIRKIGK